MFNSSKIASIVVGFSKLDVSKILNAVEIWAKQPEIYAVVLVGSWARDRAHENSDLDLMILTPNPDLFFQNTTWFNSIPWCDLGNFKIDTYYDRVYGVVKSRHLCFQQGQRIEFSFGDPSWASIDPIDPGTLAVVSSGIRIISDRYKLLETLVAAIA